MGYLPLSGGEEIGRSVELVEAFDFLYQGASHAEQFNFTPLSCRDILHLYERIRCCHCIVVYDHSNPSRNNWNELQLWSRRCG